MEDVFPALIVGGLYGVIFIVAELWRIYGTPSPEATRKFVHLSGGIVSLSFSYVFSSHWTVLLLGVLFIGIIAGTKKAGLLPSIHGVERKSQGQIYYPVAIYLTFLLCNLLKKPHFYLISVSVLAVADTLAALIGVRYGTKKYRVEDEKKSIEGSVIFFLATFIIVHLGLLLLGNLGRIESVVAAFVIASLVTIFEAVSLGGADNLFIPFGTLLLLQKFTPNPADEMFRQLAILTGIFILICGIAQHTRKLSMSGAVGVAMLSYAAWALVDYRWFLPIITGYLLFNYTNLVIETPQTKLSKFRIRAVFYTAIIPLIWVFVANFFYFDGRAHLFLVPYIVSLAASISIYWERRARLENKLSSVFKNLNFALRAMLLTFLYIPVQILLDDKILIMEPIIACFAGIIVSDRVYWIISKKVENWKRISYLRMGVAVIALGAIVALLINVFMPII
jgi:phytol kinase